MEIKTAWIDGTINKNERFAVGHDTDTKDRPVIVFLWVPELKEHDHDHIMLPLKEAKKLRDWLNENLKDTK